MLGKLLYELKEIRILDQSVLDSNNFKIETGITGQSTFRKVSIIGTTTFWTIPLNVNDNRVLYGEANGTLTYANNRIEQIGFRGHG